MTTPSRYIRKECLSKLASLSLLVFLILLSNSTAQAQSDYGSTPLANAPGAPAGSYPLSGIDNINLFNGHVSVRIPLVGEGGRGGAKSQMMWVDNSPVPYHVAMDYDPWGQPLWWEEPTSAGARGLSWGMPVVKGVQSGIGRVVCGGGDHVFGSTLTRLSFVEPDGTEHELRDTATGGQPLVTTTCSLMYQGSRGRIFVTVDGTGATFIADNPVIDLAQADYGYLEIYPSGYLLLKDGTRYYIDINGGVTQRDRNGNLITMPYSNGLWEIKDSLNRVTTQQGASGTQCTSLAPNAGNYCDQIVYKGSGGAARALTIPYDSSTYAPIGIWLPNGQSYRFSTTSIGI
jgi:hypothetical protein